LDPFGRGRCGNTAGSSARCTRRAPTPTEFLLGRRPKLPAPLEPTRILPAARLHPPHGPALPSAVAYSDCPSPPGAPADRPLPEPPFPARGGLPAAPAPSAPASTRGHSIPFGRLGYPPGPVVTIRSRARFHPGQETPWKASLQRRATWNSSLRFRLWRARFHPGHLPQRRQAAAVHALPRLRLAPPHARNVWITLACWRCRRATPCSETYRPGPIFHARSRPDPIGCSADHIYPQRAGSHPGPGVGVNPHRRPRPGDSQASPAELLAPSAAADVAGGRLRTETRPRVGRFPSKGCNSVFEPPFPFPRFVPVTAAEMLRESGFCGASSLGRSKSEMPRQSITALRWRLWATHGRTEGGIVWGGHELSNKGDHAAERAKGVGRDRAAPWRGLPKSRQSFVAP